MRPEMTEVAPPASRWPSMPSGGRGDAHAVAGGGRADEHARVRGAQRGRDDARPLQRLPRHLQHQALLRIGGQRLAGTHGEEPGVEFARVVQESALRGRRVRDRPAAVGGEGRDGVDAVVDQLPQLLRAAHAARVPAGHADDRDRLVLALANGGQRLAGRSQIGGQALEVLEVLLLVDRLGARRGLVAHWRTFLTSVTLTNPAPCRAGRTRRRSWSRPRDRRLGRRCRRGRDQRMRCARCRFHCCGRRRCRWWWARRR